jgi:hypothetical protein
MKTNLFISLMMAVVILAVPIHASDTPYMDRLVASKSTYNEVIAKSELVRTHFPNEAITVFLNNEYFTVFYVNGEIRDILPGQYEEATVVVKTDENTIDAIKHKSIRVTDAVTLKKVDFEATEHASTKTKVAVKATKVTSSVVYFFDSLFRM